MGRLRQLARRLLKPNYYADPAGYWDRRHGSRPGELAAVGHLSLSESDNARDYAAKWQAVSATLDRHGVVAGGRALDAGCGIGFFTGKLIERGLSVTGIDLSGAAIMRLEDELGDRAVFEVGGLDTYGAASPFDLVACIDVLFHITDDHLHRRSFRNLCDLVAPGGTLLIQEHLVAEDEMVEATAPARLHVRWRSLATYRGLMPGGVEVVEHLRYVVPAEGATKDLLLLRRTRA